MFQIIVTWEVDFVVCTQLIKGKKKKKKEAVHLDSFIFIFILSFTLFFFNISFETSKCVN